MSNPVLESDKYRVERELGRGGMGVVYLAQDLRLNRTVALKVLNEHLNRDQSFVKRFHKEASLISSLYHPNVVVVHGLEQVGGHFVIDMEYVDGLSLDRFGASSSIAPPVVVRIGTDILEGLAACHGVGIIHRDIKPANVLLNRVGTAKIVDFGLATAYAGHVRASISSRVSSSFFMGTPGYAPPAAWEGFDPDPGWDLYSAGVILYELLSGKVAFPGANPLAIMRQHVGRALPPLAEVVSDISPDLAHLVDHLVDGKATSSLPPTTEILASLRATPEFQKARDGETARTVTVAIQRQRRESRLKPWWSRLKRVAMPGFVLALGLAGGFLMRSVAPAVTSPARATAQPAGATPVAEGWSEGPLVLRPVVAGEASPERALWMLERDGEGGMTVTAVGDQELAHLYLEPTEVLGQFDVRGHWGAYSTPLNGGIRYGDLIGSAIFPNDGGAVSFMLTNTNTRDGSTRMRMVQLDAGKPPGQYSEFVQSLEANEIVQSLLYNELLPRQFGWASAIESRMPLRASDRLSVLRGDTAISVDGLLTDPVWRAAPDGSFPPVQAWWSDEAVVIGLNGPAVLGEARLSLGMGLFRPELQEGTAWLSIERAIDGNLSATLHSASDARPWACDWEVAVEKAAEAWRAEIRIPLSALEPRAQPLPGWPWRMNAQLIDPNSGEILFTWGATSLEAVAHGLLLNFEEPLP